MEMKTVDPRVDAVLAVPFVADVIKEAVGNWTHNREVMDPVTLAALRGYASEVAGRIFAAEVNVPDFGSNWQESVGDATYAIIQPDDLIANQIPIIVEALRETHGDKTEKFDGLWKYSLYKIAHYVGSAAYMVANNLDPELLLMTAEEGRRSMMAFAEKMAEVAPDKLIIVDPAVDSPQDVLDEILVRINPPDIGHLFD